MPHSIFDRRNIMKPIVFTLLFFVISPFIFGQQLFSLREHGEAPSRNYHVHHYKIEVSLDLEKKSVVGKTTTTLVPFVAGITTLVFDAEKMSVHRTTLGSKDLKFDVDSAKLTLHLDKSYAAGETLIVSVEYDCTPKDGMFWSGPDSGYPHKRWQVWSQGEDMTNHFWFPCYDFPNDKATSEVIATVNKKFTVLSNGKLISVKEHAKEGTKTFHWMESKPHSSYLIMVAAGEYAVLRDRAGNLPLEYYVYPDDTLNARVCFSQTPAMIRFFNEKIGFSYPWEKYGQIILQDHFGGMENTSATTLSDEGTVYDARVRVDNSPTSLIAHELAHQWWGDVVTCKDWRHTWLNESFASYFDPLYHEFTLGRDEFDYTMYNDQQAGIVTDTTRGRKPIVSVESYGENIYPRGAAVLHMLRFQLGDKLFWKGLNHYITKHQFTPVETNDLKLAIEEATGQNLYWFFDEWVYKAGHPIFSVSYRWSDSAKTVALNVKQTQMVDSLTSVFRMPVDIEITSPSGTATHRVNILTQDTVFILPSPTEPKLVLFDKGNWLLKELLFSKSIEEWKYQAEFAVNPVDRIRALQELAKLPGNEEYVSVFADRAIKDLFWAVRREAISQSGKIVFKDSTAKESMKSALLAALKDEKSAVRIAAVDQLGKYRGREVIEALHSTLNDSSYSVMSGALRSLVKADSVNALATLKQYLDYPSFRNRVSNTALNAISNFDSMLAVTLSLGKALYGQEVSTRYTALGILHKYAKGRADIQSFYMLLLHDKNNGIRSVAARSLGDFGDRSVLPELEQLAGDKDNSASDAAKGSIEKIQKRIDATK